MASVTGVPTLSFIDLYTNDTTIPSGYSLGMLIWGNDGKAFRYALNGASALVMGNALQSSVVDTQFTNMAVGVAAVSGATQISITNGTTTVNANDFVGGSLTVYTAGTVAIGDEYTIVGHTTGTSGATLIVQLDRPLRAAFTTSAKVSMRRSPYSGVIQSPATTLTGTVAGVAMFAGTLAQYNWIQTHGVAGVLSDGTSILVGSSVAVPSGTAGAITLETAGLSPVGYAQQAGASAHAIGVDLRID